MADFSPAFAHANGDKRMPTSGEIEDGFGCGPLSLPLFNGLINALYAELGALMTLNGITPSNASMEQVAQAVQAGRLNFAVATGTANAWVVDPVLAVPAYAAGRVLWIKAPATNSNASVTVNVSSLGTRPVKKSDGSNPAVGDLVIGRWYPTIDDGTNICVVAFLSSDLAANKSPFNLQQVSFPTRATLSGTGFVTYQTGSYTKKSATSNLVISISTNSFATSTAPGVLRLTAGASVIQAVISNNDGGQTRPAANARKVFTGVAAGALSWTLALGRNDGIAWSGVINPTNADAAFIPTETTTSVTFEELEP